MTCSIALTRRFVARITSSRMVNAVCNGIDISENGDAEVRNSLDKRGGLLKGDVGGQKWAVRVRE